MHTKHFFASTVIGALVIAGWPGPAEFDQPASALFDESRDQTRELPLQTDFSNEQVLPGGIRIVNFPDVVDDRVFAFKRH